MDTQLSIGHDRLRRAIRSVLLDCPIWFACLLWLATDAGVRPNTCRADDGSPPATSNDAIPTTLRVATRQVPPFAMLNEAGQWEGISIELLREVKADLQNEADHEIAIEFYDLGLEEMLDAVERDEVDLAAAALTVNYDRERRMDFSHPFHSSGLGIAVGAEQRGSGWSGIAKAIFSTTFLRILAALFAAMFVSAVAIYLFERKHNREQFDQGWVRGVASGLWWAAVTLTTVGYGDKVPRSLPGRLIGLLWMFGGLFIVASFTAAVTSALTVTKLSGHVSGPTDLSRVRVATVEDSTSVDYLRARHIMFQRLPNVAAALDRLQAGQCDAVVYDAPILRYTTLQNYAEDVYVLPVSFERQNYAFALPSGSPLRERINQILLRRVMSSSWEGVLSSYLGENIN